MKKSLSLLLVVVFILSTMTCFTSCGIQEEDKFLGFWESESGALYGFAKNEDGEYHAVSYRNGIQIDFQTYSANDSVITLTHKTVGSLNLEYKFKGKSLYLDDKEYKKTDEYRFSPD